MSRCVLLRGADAERSADPLRVPCCAQSLTKQDAAAARTIERRARKLARLTDALTHWRAKLLSNTRSWEERNRLLRAEKDSVIKHYGVRQPAHPSVPFLWALQVAVSQHSSVSFQMANPRVRPLRRSSATA